MSPCPEFEMQLVARRDGELDEARNSSLLGHLEVCAACRAFDRELVDRDGRLRESFDRVVAHSPPIPRRLQEASSRPGIRTGRRVLLATSLIMAALLLVAVLLPGRKGARAEATQVVRRAMERWLECDTVEALFRSELRYRDGNLVLATQLRIFVRRDGSVLIVEERKEPEEEPRSIAGFDGQVRWQYNSEERLLHLYSPGSGTFRFGEGMILIGLGQQDLISFFANELPRRLVGHKPPFSVIEEPVRSNAGVGLRRFRLVPREGSSSPAKAPRITTKIDEVANRIVTMVVEAVAGGFRLRSVLRPVSFNGIHEEDFFSPQRHVPHSTPVRRHDR